MLSYFTMGYMILSRLVDVYSVAPVIPHDTKLREEPLQGSTVKNNEDHSFHSFSAKEVFIHFLYFI